MKRPEPKDAFIPSLEDLNGIIELIEDERLNDTYTGPDLDDIDISHLISD